MASKSSIKCCIEPIGGASFSEFRVGNDAIMAFSYDTLVGLYISGEGVYISDQKYSSTTSKNLNKWVRAMGCATKELSERGLAIKLNYMLMGAINQLSFS